MDDVDYWRAKAGWYDDDYTMTQYNYGVGGKGGSGSYSSTRRSGPSGKQKFLAATISIIAAVFLYKAISKRRKKKKSKHSSERTEASGRSRSTSRSRRSSKSSRSSRSRSRGTSAAHGNYQIMEDEQQLRKIGRSTSRDRRGRSHSGSPRKHSSRSASRSRRQHSRDYPPTSSIEIVWNNVWLTSFDWLYVALSYVFFCKHLEVGKENHQSWTSIWRNPMEHARIICRLLYTHCTWEKKERYLYHWTTFATVPK